MLDDSVIEIRLTTTNSIGSSAAYEFTCMTSPLGSPNPPINARCEQEDYTSLVVRWDPDTSGDQTAIVSYGVYVRRADGSGLGGGFYSVTLGEPDFETRSLQINDLQSGTEYDISVTTTNAAS